MQNTVGENDLTCVIVTESKETECTNFAIECKYIFLLLGDGRFKKKHACFPNFVFPLHACQDCIFCNIPKK